MFGGELRTEKREDLGVRDFRQICFVIKDEGELESSRLLLKRSYLSMEGPCSNLYMLGSLISPNRWPNIIGHCEQGSAFCRDCWAPNHPSSLLSQCTDAAMQVAARLGDGILLDLDSIIPTPVLDHAVFEEVDGCAACTLAKQNKIIGRRQPMSSSDMQRHTYLAPGPLPKYAGSGGGK
jgi:hypothetical protein